MRILIKLGGSLLDDAESRGRLAAEIAGVVGKVSAVIVHGGGRQMTRFLADRGIESRFVNGLRVTSPEVIDAVLKVFAGSVNTKLVAALRAAGSRPAGLTGIDGGLVLAEPMGQEYGLVGRIIASNPRILETLTEGGFLPVVACVAGDDQGHIFNVNADQMAASCAGAFHAQKLVFLTDVEGVRDAAGCITPDLTVEGARELISNGTASGGMQAKLEAAMSALEKGVEEIHIAAGGSPGTIAAILAGDRRGTKLCAS